MENRKVVVHTDGGSRGNPGPAAAAFTIEIDGREIHRDSKFLGRTTNNQAEYSGVLLAVEWLIKNLKKDLIYSVDFILDSELVVRQVNGIYKVKDVDIKIIFNQIMQEIQSSGYKINFQHVRREKNKIADFLVNQELDNNL